MGYKVHVHCDKCGDGYTWSVCSVSKSAAMRIVRREGWSVGKHGWFCPNCRKARKHKEDA